MRSSDRISELPDSILLHILSKIPFKSVVRTSTLSKRWIDLPKQLWAYASTLNFGKEFAEGQTPEEYTTNVNRFLKLHAGKEIKKLCVFFYPGEEYEPDVERWIRFATEKSVEVLDLDLSQGIQLARDFDYTSNRITDVRKPSQLPLSFVFNCDSLKHLQLILCHLNPHLKLDSLTSLHSLSFRQVNIDDHDLKSLLEYSSHLEALTLRECHQLKIIDISSQVLCLRSLRLVDCWNVRSIKIDAPTLISLYFYGYICNMTLTDVSSLVDAFVCTCGWLGTGLVSDWMLMNSVIHVKTLTICSNILMDGLEEKELTPENFPMTFPNLQELQLLIKYKPNIGEIYGFFRLCHCPFLKWLFIEFPTSSMEHKIWPSEAPSDCVLDNLKMIKMKSFCGGMGQIQLVNFFLEKATGLETMILVAPRYVSSDVALIALREKLVFSQEASIGERIVLCKHSEDDAFLPTHTVL